jgi:hypothetical protein
MGNHTVRAGRRALASVALATVLLSSVPAALSAQSRDVRSVARLFVSDGVAGRFGEPVCSDTVDLAPHAEAAYTQTLLDRSAGDDAPLVVDAGGLLTPHGVARFAARDLPDALVTLVHELGYDALAFGENDLGAPRPRMIELARRLAAGGVPYVASNLSCDDDAAALCEGVIDASDAPLLVHTGTVQAAFLAMLDADVLGRVAPDRAEGLRVAPIPDALPPMVRAARAAGAELVVVVLAVTADEAFTVARTLPEDARPDLLLLAGEGDDLLFARPATVVPAIVSAPPGSGAEVLVGRSEAQRHGFELLALPLTEEGVAPAAPVTHFLETVGPAYCDAWGRALPGGHLSRGMGPTSVAALAAQVVREHAGADVAFLNADAIDASFRAADARQLSASDLYIALEYDEPIVVADVPASWLAEAWPRLERHRVLSPGLGTDEDDPPATPLEEQAAREDEEAAEDDEEEDEQLVATNDGTGTEAPPETGDGEEESPEDALAHLRVRGRPPVAHTTYRVATIRFLAEGGDDALPELPEGSEWHMLGEPLADGTFHYDSLRDVVLAALEPTSTRDPRDVRPSPNDAPEWIVRGAVDASFSGSSVSNPAGYDAALLATEAAIAMGIVADVHLDATAPDWTWESRALARYRTQWAPSTDPGTAGAFTEAADQIQIRSLLSYRGLRRSEHAFYIPDGYVEGFLESEFTRPDARTYHWMLFRPTAGLRFPLTTDLDVKLQAGVQSQLLDPTAQFDFGAGASILLRPWTVFELGERTLTFEGNVDFFATSLGNQNFWQTRGQLDLSLDLAGPLALTFGGTMYLQQNGTQDLGATFTATAGLRVAAVTRAVGP